MPPRSKGQQYPVRRVGIAPHGLAAADLTLPYVPVNAVVVSEDRIITRPWLEWSNGVSGAIDAIATEIAGMAGGGLLSGTIADQPLGLGPSDAGTLFTLTDFGHVVRWTGSVWTFAPGDVENAFLQARVLPPATPEWWQECDGTPTSYLIVGGATLTSAGFTTPNLKGSPAFLKSAATYGGGIVPATSPSISGGGDHSHSFGFDQPTHNHGMQQHAHHIDLNTNTSGTGSNADAGGSFFANSQFHTHNVAGDTQINGATLTDQGGGGHTDVTTSSGGAHSHSISGGEPAYLGVRVYFRR